MHHHRSLFALLALVLLLLPLSAQSQDLDYYFSEGTQFNQSIPSPGEFLGYNVGEYHTRHDRIVAYFRELEQHSDLITVEEIGLTNQHRPMIFATITSNENHANLENLRQQHLQISDPDIQVDGFDDHPIVVQLGYGVHGNETSSSEVAMLQAYHLVAGQGAEVERYLDEGIFLVEPVLNPDGRDRHTHWANAHRGQPLVADPLDREHNEVWPGGRTNHYWFDLNRDWLPLVNIESQARIEFLQQWNPNVVTDYHEMGTNSTYFFEPTEPELSWNPLLPEELYTEITLDFADYYAEALDEIGTFYWTKEDIFDNTYPGYGSTYPNFLGGLGLVFEQASARGHIQKSTHHGVLTFPYAIRNQLRTSLATVEAAIDNRETLLEYQQDFFTSAIEEAEDFAVEAYVFGDAHDASRNRAFLDLLLRHGLEVYELSETREYDGHTFEPGSGWVVPTHQPKYRLVRSIFERTDDYTGSAGSRASAWTMSLAYGLPDAEIQEGSYPQGARVNEVPTPEGIGQVPQTSYAYLLDWSDYNAAQALYHLLDKDVHVEVAFEPFTAHTNEGEYAYSRGSIAVPVQVQNVDAAALHRIILKAEEKADIRFQSTDTGYSAEGIDLGSRNFRPLEKPQALTIVGDGTSAYEAGELWHLLDTRVQMPITKVDRLDFSRVHLPDYNVLVLISGNYSFLEDEHLEDLRRWIQDGGTLIAFRSAAQWATRNGLTPHVETQDGEQQPETEVSERRDFADARALQTRQQIAGVIAEVDLDTTHPIGFGYHRRDLAVWRNHSFFLQPSTNPYSTVAKYTDEPRLSGFMTDENEEQLRETASILVDEIGGGSVILFADNPNFRGFWYGTNKLFFNAIFFGGTL